MELAELTEYLVKAVVVKTDNVVVTKEDYDGDTVRLSVTVDNSDMGKVIGKDGKVINAIRTLVQEASYLKDNKYVKIEIDKCASSE